MGILEKIKEVELEMSRTQNNKATNAHIGMLKARLAKLRTELLAPASGPGGGGEVHRHQYIVLGMRICKLVTGSYHV
jgi:ribosome-interacting GTPase 1